MNEIDLNKKFWVFGFHRYYPRGGLEDICGTFDTLEYANQFIKEEHLKFEYDHIEIFDVNKRMFV